MFGIKEWIIVIVLLLTARMRKIFKVIVFRFNQSNSVSFTIFNSAALKVAC